MKRYIIMLSVALVGCSNSAYESGWNADKSVQTFHECAMTAPSKNIYYDQNADRLVPMGLLTADEASQAKKHIVMTGNKECLVYAAYGLHPSNYTFVSNKEKHLTHKIVEYRCKDSPIPCPGKAFTITDGKVINIQEVK